MNYLKEKFQYCILNSKYVKFMIEFTNLMHNVGILMHNVGNLMHNIGMLMHNIGNLMHNVGMLMHKCATFIVQLITSKDKPDEIIDKIRDTLLVRGAKLDNCIVLTKKSG